VDIWFLVRVEVTGMDGETLSLAFTYTTVMRKHDLVIQLVNEPVGRFIATRCSVWV